jgi:hypothetical protein
MYIALNPLGAAYQPTKAGSIAIAIENSLLGDAYRSESNLLCAEFNHFLLIYLFSQEFLILN